MKGRLLLGCLVLSGGLAISYQSVGRQMVSAETKELISSQQEIASKIESSSSTSDIASEVLAESTEITEASSSIEEISSSESMGSIPSTTGQVETEESTTESNLDASKVPEAVVNVQTTLPAAKVEENYQFSVVKNQTTEEFIQTIGADAQYIAWNEGLYASVMIAQAILETGSGNSQLARPPHHNLFGIKGSYQGKNVTFNTQEDKGNGELYTIKSAFRQYPSYKESLEDYASLLKKGISGNPSFYQATWKEHAPTYKEATKALTGKYATDTSYDRKLNALIETYNLTVYDSEPSNEETSDSSQLETFSEGTEVSVEQAENETMESSTADADESKVIKSKRKQPVVTLPPVIQRPAKEVTGNRMAQ